MKPYFDTNHLAGLLLLIVVLAWGAMELGEFFRGWRARKGATRIDGAGWWLLAVAVAVAANVVLYAAPHVVPAAAMEPGAVAFAVGLVIMVGGVLLRGWSFKTLGEYFTFNVKVSSDQPVVTSGPYRLLRHPSYTGLLMFSAGIGVASANWVGVAGMTLPPLALLVWRIHIEETALLATLGDRYRTYASHHKRLVPIVW